MTEGLAREIAEEKMRNAGLKRKHYLLRFRHLRMGGNTSRTLKAANDLFFLIDVPKGITVKSKAGIYDLVDTGITEMQHVHRGSTSLKNTTGNSMDLTLLQVIPKIKK